MILADWIMFKGTKSTALGVYVTTYPPITLPEERVAFVEVPGRNGGPLDLTLGDTLLITGTPGATRNEAYIYKFSVGGVMFEEFWITGISTETGGGPNKNYVITDAILDVADGQTTIEVEIEQRFRQIYLPPETVQVLQTRTLIVTVTDTAILSAEMTESAATAAIAARFGTYIQSRSVPALRLTATAPNGSTIARVDIYDAEEA